MKMAKPSEQDIEAAGKLLQILNSIDEGWPAPVLGDGPTDLIALLEETGAEFDPCEEKHLQALCNSLIALALETPSYYNRVISGMCHVIMYDKNKIVDPDLDHLELHPELLAAKDAMSTQAARDVAAERKRQVDAEGWTPEHDDKHDLCELARAAACYAGNAAGHVYVYASAVPWFWPWDRSWWKPTTPRADLVKAGALILAEIERIDRKVAKAAGVQSKGTPA